jgi:hypothetical protein
MLGLGKFEIRTPTGCASMDRERVRRLLHADSQAAKKSIQGTTEYLDLAIQQHRNPGPTKSTEERVRCAARSYRDAITREALADARLRDCEIRGFIPDDLQVRRSPQRAGNLARSQQTA